MRRAQRDIAGIQPFAELAQSATTAVYKGYQPALERFVLLKVLRPGFSHDEERVRRFEDEARLIAQVKHPNVVAIYASGRDDGQAYIAAEFVDGFDLRGLMARGPLPVELAVFIVREAGRGLRAAHAHGILHRDLKPSNILIAHDGQVKLTDFGMASFLEEEAVGAEVRGTPGYLAPELVRGEPPTRASDLFSLGATLYEALAGRAAFVGGSTGALLDAVLHHDPLPRLERFAALPADLHAVCARLLAKDPAARYRDADALVAALEAVQAAHGLAVAPPALAVFLDDPDAYRRLPRAGRAPDAAPEALPEHAARRAGPETRARPGRFLRWGVALAFLLVAGLGGSLLLGGEQPPPPQPADDRAEPAAVGLPEVDTSRFALAESTAVVEQDAPAMAVEEPEQPAPDPARRVDSLATPARAAEDTTTVPSPDVRPPGAAAEPAATGTLSIAVQPYAEVFVDGMSKGESPPDVSLTASVGRHRVVLRHPQFPDYEGDVVVRPGETASLAVSLWDLVGRLSIDAQPWAEVLIDDEVRDTTPAHDLIVAPGARRLTLRNPALGAWDTTLVVQGGDVRVLRFNLHTKSLRR